MKRKLPVFALFWGVLVIHPAALRGQTISPVGSWEVTISGSDRGTSMMTFSNDFTVGGYGILRKQFGLFTLTGNWSFNSKGDVVVAYIQTLNGVGTAVSFSAKVRQSGSFQAKGTGTSGGLRFRAQQVSDYPDLSGSWIASVRRHTKTLHETYTVTASTNSPAVFDVTGQGLSDTGSYTVTGTIIAASDDKLNASIDRTSGVTTQRSSLYGRFKPHKPEMDIKGVDDNGVHVSVTAVQ